MALLDATLDSMGNHLAGLITHLSLHSADPGLTGANETTAARVAAGWAAATSGGDITATNKSFTGGASNGAVLYVGYWSALTAGTFHGSRQIPNNGTNDLSFNAAGEYTLTSVTENGASS